MHFLLFIQSYVIKYSNWSQEAKVLEEPEKSYPFSFFLLFTRTNPSLLPTTLCIDQQFCYRKFWTQIAYYQSSWKWTRWVPMEHRHVDGHSCGHINIVKCQQFRAITSIMWKSISPTRKKNDNELYVDIEGKKAQSDRICKRNGKNTRQKQNKINTK